MDEDLGRQKAHSIPVHDLVTELVLCGRAADVATVLVDGMIVVDEGAVTTVDEAALGVEARRRGAALGDRLRALD